MNTNLVRLFLTLSVILLGILYFNCSDDSVSPTSSPLTITGTISNWDTTKAILQAQIYSETHNIYSIASCTIDTKGNFSLTLPASLSDTSLFRADSIFTRGCNGNGTAVFNPPDAKGNEIYLFNVYDTNNRWLGQIARNNSVLIQPGTFNATYMYANETVTASGYRVCMGDSLFFNGSASTVWSELVETYTRSNDSIYSAIYSNTEPAGGRWWFYGAHEMSGKINRKLPDK